MCCSMSAKKRFIEQYLADCIRCADDHFTTFSYVTNGAREYIIIGQRNSNKKIRVCVSDEDFMGIIKNVVRNLTI